MKKVTTILLVFLQMALAQKGSISGVITDKETGEPLIAANVTLSGSALKTATGSATDLEGRYLIHNLPAGRYQLKVNYIGYEFIEKRIKLRAGEQLKLNIALAREAIQLDTYVVTASRRRERIEDAPAAISVITQKDIRRESNTNLGDYLKSVKGVEFTQSGIDSYNLSARGFNASFSSRLLTLTDGRMANVPSLRLIAYNVIPVSFEDVKQIEVVLGPSSALYGPNAHSGVLNIVTSSPLESQGTSVNIQGGFLDQSNTDMLRKLTFRHSQKFSNFGFKISAVALAGQDWRHFNEDEYEGHDPAFIGRYKLIHDRINTGGGSLGELGSPTFGDPEIFDGDWLVGEIPNNGKDDNNNGFIDEDSTWIGERIADGIDNWYLQPTLFLQGEDKSPVIDEAMVAAAAGDPFHRYRVPGTNITLWGVTEEWIGMKYADGIDNDGDGFVDEGIDDGIDDGSEAWYDGVDNDGDGRVDEEDEIGNKWLSRFGSYKPSDAFGQNGGFGDYKYDEKGHILFDTNDDGIYGGEGDSTINYGNLSSVVLDANDDGINDYPEFDVRNFRYDLRGVWAPREDLSISFSHGYAWARNINITGIARYLADGWQYNYYQTKIAWRNFFLQAYLNTSHSGNPKKPTRNLATGGLIYDRSKKFSAQFQHAMEFFNGNFRFVWGLDYFLTMPDTRGTILSDKEGWDHRDNNGNGEAGSPIVFADANDNTWYDKGEGYTRWNTEGEPFEDTNGDGAWNTGEPFEDLNGNGVYDKPGTQFGVIPTEDYARGAIADGIDNDGDGLIDEGIDEKKEDNRKTVNELGTYYQFNWKVAPKWEFIQATRLDVHDRLTDLVEFNNQYSHNYSPLNWRFDFSKTDGLQVSPKVGLVYRPRENQTFRLTWATAFNTPSNQALFLDLFVTRVSIFKVYARGASGGYVYPRDGNRVWDPDEEYNDVNGNGQWDEDEPFEDKERIYVFDTESFRFEAFDPQNEILFYPSVDPKIEGFYNYKVDDLPEIEAEQVRTWEFGYKGRISKALYGTLDIFTNHYNSFVSPTTFITPIVIKRSVLETDWDGDSVVNQVVDVANNIIADREDYDKSFKYWRDNIVGVAAIDTTPGLAPPVVVGYINYGEVDVSGLDASITWLVNRSLTIDAHYSFLNITEFLNPITNAKDPINAPRHKGGISFRYAPPSKPLAVTLNYRYVDAFPWSSGVYFGRIHTYNIFDLHSSYKINRYLSAMVTVNNILNYRHTEIIGGPRLGRMVIFRLQASL